MNRESQKELLDAISKAQATCITEQELSDIKIMVILLYRDLKLS